MFSQRTSWSLAANRLALALEARRQAGRQILDLTLSNPTQAGIPYPDDLLVPLADPGLTYQPEARGLVAAREAVARDYGRRGWAVGIDRLLLTASTSEAYAYLFKLLCNPGDAILVPRPSYPLFEFLADLETVRVDRYALAYDGEWHLSVDALERAVTDRTRAVVVVNPGNPTGSYLKRAEAERLFELCASRGLAVISDEVFADYAFAPDPRRLASTVADGPCLAFSLGGLSKSCGLPQLKLGWIAVSGPERLRAEATARLEIIADTFLSVGTPVQQALPSLLARLPELQAPIATRVRSNLRLLREALASPSPASLLAAEGGWSAVLRVPATAPEEERALRLLEREGVLVHPGFFFDFPTEAYLVLSLLPPTEVFARGVGALLRHLGATAVL
jgi:aspartate/methionine/tyrosine aminotransferase